MTLLTIRLPKRLALLLALALFVAGHIVVAIAQDFTVLLVARFITAFATGAFWPSRPSSPLAPPDRSSAPVRKESSAPADHSAPSSECRSVRSSPKPSAGAARSGPSPPQRSSSPYSSPASSPTTPPAASAPQSEASSPPPLRTPLAHAPRLRHDPGGVVAAYSYIAPLLTDRAGVAAGLIPVVLTAFGIGSFIGTLLGGRLGDTRPGLVTIVTPAASTVLLVLIGIITDQQILHRRARRHPRPVRPQR